MKHMMTLRLEYADGRPAFKLRTSACTVTVEAGPLLRVLDEHRNVYLGVKSITTLFEPEPKA